MKTLLIATVGGQVGRAVIDTIAECRDRIRVVGVNSIAEVSTNFRCDVTYLVPGTADLPDWLARMREILRAERPDMVLAGRDDDLGPLARLKQEAEFAPMLADNPGPASVAILNDKYASWTFARRRGLPFVETATTGEEVAALLARHGLPLIVKPRSGSEGRGVHALTTPGEVAGWQGAAGVVFQPFLDPPPLDELGRSGATLGQPAVFAAPWRSYINVAVHVAQDGTISCAGASRLEIRGPARSRHSACDDPAAVAAACRFAGTLAALDFRGPLVVQGRCDADGRFFAFELNGRVNAGVGGRALLGRDELAPILERLLGPDRPPAKRPNPLSWIEMHPDWDVVALPEAARLRADGVWHAAR